MKKNKLSLSNKILNRVVKSTNSDVWGVTFSKRKFNKSFKQMLVFFEAGLRRDIIRELKSNFMRYPRFVKPTFGATTLLMDEKPVKLPTLFILLFKNYYSYKIKTKYRSSLINSWCLNRLLRMKNYLPRRLFFLNKSQYFDLGKRLPRVKNFNYIQQKRVDLLKLQYFYCFKKLSTVRRFLYKIEYSRST